MARTPLDLRQYIRAPDSEFWFELFREPPRPGKDDTQRRARLSRFALGAGVVFSWPYIIVPLFIKDLAISTLLAINLIALMFYLLGMWMASLENHRLARTLLVVTMQTQIFLLIMLTGQQLNMFAFTFVAAALARVLYSPLEPRQMVSFVCFPVFTLLLALTVFREPMVIFPDSVHWQLSVVRIGNVLVSLFCVLLILGVLEREVLRSEAELTDARERSDQLLYAVLPESIALQLKQRSGAIATRHDQVTVLFADIAGFTPWASRQPPDQVVALLETIFSRFDERLENTGAEKIKTIGDAYMVIAGAPEPCKNHAEVMARLALALMEEVQQIHDETGIPLSLRVGIHSGPVVAGVIGKVRFSYDVWGDTVNTASRMESHGEPGKIQISGETRALLPDIFVTEYRSKLDIKGKGPMDTWWLKEVVKTE